MKLLRLKLVNHRRRNKASRNAVYVQLRDNINNYFAKLAKHYQWRPENVQIIDTGINAVIVKFTDKKKKYALKIPSSGFIAHEVFFYNQLKKHRIKSPEVITFNLDKSIIPYPFMIMQWIDGAQSFENHVDDKIAQQGGQLYAQELIKVHRITVAGFGSPIDVKGKAWTSRSWLVTLREFINQNIQPGTPKAIFRKRDFDTIKILSWQNKKLEIDQPKLLHGDLPNSLMRIQPQIEFLAFIDPSLPIGGDPMYDLASIYVVDEMANLGSGFMRGFTNSYRSMQVLTKAEFYRCQHLKLFHYFWKTCYFYDHGWNYHKLYLETLTYLDTLTN
jgi:aminoglycoside phosphotransferase (APT) family kinase protein